MKWKFVCLFWLIVVHLHLSAQTISYTIDSIGKELGLAIKSDTLIHDSGGYVSYEICNDTDSVILNNYLLLLGSEFNKYPEDFFGQINLKTIVLAKKLNCAGQNRAAVPDPAAHTLYLAIDGAYGVATPTYLVHVMHHELNHCTEYAVWNDMFYRWKRWKRTNQCLFKYSSGGAKAYLNRTIDWYAMSHPKKGFVNLYSTTGQEEDRSELVALMMGDEEREYLLKFLTVDKILKHKIKLLLQQMNQLTNSTNSYWQIQMDAAIKQK